MKFEPKVMKFEPKVMKFEPKVMKFEPKVMKFEPKAERVANDFEVSEFKDSAKHHTTMHLYY
jgi:hypothetical protein